MSSLSTNPFVDSREHGLVIAGTRTSARGCCTGAISSGLPNHQDLHLKLQLAAYVDNMVSSARLSLRRPRSLTRSLGRYRSHLFHKTSTAYPLRHPLVSVPIAGNPPSTFYSASLHLCSSRFPLATAVARISSPCCTRTSCPSLSFRICSVTDYRIAFSYFIFSIFVNPPLHHCSGYRVTVVSMPYSQGCRIYQYNFITVDSEYMCLTP